MSIFTVRKDPPDLLPLNPYSSAPQLLVEFKGYGRELSVFEAKKFISFL